MPTWRDPQFRVIHKKGLKHWYRQELKPELRPKLKSRNVLINLNTTDLAVAITRAAEVREQILMTIDPNSFKGTFADALKDRLDDLDVFAEEVRRGSGLGTGDPEREPTSELVDKLEDMRGY